eukprot:scaffold86437_cov30-Tisochrysis_lutea.AAC.1
MGVHLSTPNTDKVSEAGTLAGVPYGVSAMQGWRTSMEQTYSTGSISAPGQAAVPVFCVFAGFGGPLVALFCKSHLLKELSRLEAWSTGNVEEALRAVFLRMDEMLRSQEHVAELSRFTQESCRPPSPDEAPPGDDLSSELESTKTLQSRSKVAEDGDEGLHVDPFVDLPGDHQNHPSNEGASPAACAGCSALVATFYEGKLYLANVGSSRAILCRKGSVVAVGTCHCPSEEPEGARIIRAGGFVADTLGVHRVNGSLKVSRCIGYLDLKANTSLPPNEQILIACPEVQVLDISQDDDFVLIASDGVWEAMSDVDAAGFITDRLQKSLEPAPLVQIVEELLDTVLSPALTETQGKNNMTCILIDLRNVALSHTATANTTTPSVSNSEAVEESENPAQRRTGSSAIQNAGSDGEAPHRVRTSSRSGTCVGLTLVAFNLDAFLLYDDAAVTLADRRRGIPFASIVPQRPHLRVARALSIVH